MTTHPTHGGAAPQDPSGIPAAQATPTAAGAPLCWEQRVLPAALDVRGAHAWRW